MPFRWNIRIPNKLLPVFIAMDAFLLFFVFCAHAQTGTFLDRDEVSLYLEEHAGKDARIYTSSDLGADLEYDGFTNIYIDPRPELYMSDLNQEKDVLAEMSRYGNGYSSCYDPSRMPEDWESPVTDKEMTAWLDSYGFDYLVVDPFCVRYLNGFLAGSPDYERIFTSADGILLYAKTDRIQN